LLLDAKKVSIEGSQPQPEPISIFWKDRIPPQLKKIVLAENPETSDGSVINMYWMPWGFALKTWKKYKFYKPVGCAHCNSMGYRGRTGVHELLLVNDMIRDAILARQTSGEIRRSARESSDLVTMREDGFYKVLKGITSNLWKISLILWS